MLVVIVDVLAGSNRWSEVEVGREAEGKTNHGSRVIHVVAICIGYSIYKIYVHFLSLVESA
jgi:hypothetical protein